MLFSIKSHVCCSEVPKKIPSCRQSSAEIFSNKNNNYVFLNAFSLTWYTVQCTTLRKSQQFTYFTDYWNQSCLSSWAHAVKVVVYDISDESRDFVGDVQFERLLSQFLKTRVSIENSVITFMTNSLWLSHWEMFNEFFFRTCLLSWNIYVESIIVGLILQRRALSLNYLIHN